MHVEVDLVSCAAYITLLPRAIKPGEAKLTMSVCDTITLDFDADGHLIGVELLALGVLHPELDPHSTKGGG